eukprot:15347693-Ditylum_brightwellii.AAC.1
MEVIAQVIKGQDIQYGKVVYSLVKSLLKGDNLQVFQNEEESQEVKDGAVFTKCLAAVTEYVFPKKSYKIQKKYIVNICKPLRLGWILQMIKLKDYLVHFPVLGRVTAMKISHKEFVDILEDGILYQWKLEFEKEEKAELQKPLRKTIAHAKKEHDEDRKRKHQDKPKLHHERHRGLGKHHQGKRKKKICNYHGTDKCNIVQSCRKHVQPTHCIME